jgi:hypothetical protein
MLVTIALAALVVVLLAFPTVGNWVRGIVGSVFGGETTLDILGGVASIIGIVSACAWVYDKLFGGTGATPATGAAPQGRPGGQTEATRRVIPETNDVAQRVSDFAAEYNRRSPFKLQPGERSRMDYESPEYQADQQRKGDEYSALVNEMRERYRVELLPDVIRVRGALADQGITATQLEEIYRRPKNDTAVANLAQLLWDMAGRLERRQ